ncbi:hypothetical protein [Granulicella aggregans]|uniref:hypothetical protein n=1 Tax=Granulicella aggregans TaxID=474949 RepID=UPI0021E03D8D|nr:hypothetical protein [Granulicella aggregans]
MTASIGHSWAQQTAKVDQKALLTQVRHAYYLPSDRGVQGFSCNVSFDWAAVLERASGRKIPAKEPTLVSLKSATTNVVNDYAKGAVVKGTYPGAQPLAGSPVASRQKILNNLVKASLDGWDPFLSNRIFPLEATSYRFESVPTGYRLTLDGGTFFSILDLDPKLKITHGESHLNGTTTEFTPEFDTSTHGWLLTSLKTVTTHAATGLAAETKAASSSSPSEDEDKASFIYSYQFVDDLLVPKRVIVQYGDGQETPYELTDCTLIKTSPVKP